MGIFEAVESGGLGDPQSSGHLNNKPLNNIWAPRARITLEIGVLADTLTMTSRWLCYENPLEGLGTGFYIRTGRYRCTVTVGTFEARSRSLVLLPRNRLFKGERL